MVASDWSGLANQIQYSPCEIQALSKQLAQAIEQQGAGKKSKTANKGKKATTKRVKVNGRVHVVYKGSRGGEYIKHNGSFVSLKNISH